MRQLRIIHDRTRRAFPKNPREGERERERENNACFIDNRLNSQLTSNKSDAHRGQNSDHRQNYIFPPQQSASPTLCSPRCVFHSCSTNFQGSHDRGAGCDATTIKALKPRDVRVDVQLYHPRRFERLTTKKKREREREKRKLFHPYEFVDSRTLIDSCVRNR